MVSGREGMSEVSVVSEVVLRTHHAGSICCGGDSFPPSSSSFLGSSIGERAWVSMANG